MYEAKREFILVQLKNTRFRVVPTDMIKYVTELSVGDDKGKAVLRLTTDEDMALLDSMPEMIRKLEMSGVQTRVSQK